MHVKPLSCFPENVDHLVLDDVAPQWDERRSSVVDHEKSVFGQQPFHQTVESSNVDASVPHQLEPAVLGEGPVDRVRVDALDRATAASEILSEDAGHQRLSDTSLPLK